MKAWPFFVVFAALAGASVVSYIIETKPQPSVPLPPPPVSIPQASTEAVGNLLNHAFGFRVILSPTDEWFETGIPVTNTSKVHIVPDDQTAVFAGRLVYWADGPKALKTQTSTPPHLNSLHTRCMQFSNLSALANMTTTLELKAPLSTALRSFRIELELHTTNDPTYPTMATLERLLDKIPQAQDYNRFEGEFIK